MSSDGSIRLSEFDDLSQAWPHSLVLIPSLPSNLLMTILSIQTFLQGKECAKPLMRVSAFTPQFHFSF